MFARRWAFRIHAGKTLEHYRAFLGVLRAALHGGFKLRLEQIAQPHVVKAVAACALSPFRSAVLLPGLLAVHGGRRTHRAVCWRSPCPFPQTGWRQSCSGQAELGGLSSAALAIGIPNRGSDIISPWSFWRSGRARRPNIFRAASLLGLPLRATGAQPACWTWSASRKSFWCLMGMLAVAERFGGMGFEAMGCPFGNGCAGLYGVVFVCRPMGAPRNWANIALGSLKEVFSSDRLLPGRSGWTVFGRTGGRWMFALALGVLLAFKGDALSSRCGRVQPARAPVAFLTRASA